MALAAVVAAFVVHKVVSARELSSGRESLLARQRAVAQTLGAQWAPLRDTIEARILEAAAHPELPDLVEVDARRGDFKTQPGLYLRLRLADAHDAQGIRRVAVDSRKDAFASCLLREPNEPGLRGELDGGAFAEQPWNLGRAYSSTRILTGEWVSDVQGIDDDLRLRVFQDQFERAVGGDIPRAVDIVTRARFFLLALDEDVPEAAALSEGGAITEEALQRVAHPTHVHLFELPSGRPILRLMRTGEMRVIGAGERPVADSETRDAMQRQANNCALAGRVEEALASPARP